ncbi:MAG: LOG family protein [Saccharolobus sp.]|uniref:Molybdenum cofactor carrier protein Mcp1 n=1 Tax=Saccharolobus shibatae (strain ATCC 51178 / DSM 5389 / JCM 8931 / NBRC 15437 / B12) TaxID=523848 RepID=A0A8F5GTQ3_SACSH|nr:LOG family protein [Saccharolobus shibatae]MCH4814750.1 LOG family protein [Saccharolobus shibatae]QXJ29189.1 molybdenum cofactor carrier protein Mcp1 [Saccharolobus shibatae B12]
MIISIAAHSEEPNSELAEKARKFVRSIKACNPTLLLGGYWGLMKVVVDEALKENMKTVLILPIEREDVTIPRDVISIKSGCEFRCRSVILVRSGDILVSLGGGVGTEIEIMIAYAMGKPIFALSNTGLSTDQFAKAFPEYIDDRKVIKIRYFEDSEEMAKEICKSEMKSAKTTFG